MSTTRTLPKTKPPVQVTVPSGYESDISLFAVRYKQGNRTVYSLVLPLDTIATLITPPDPNVATPGNRMIRPAHADGFATYIRQRADWVMPGMLLRAPAMFNFEMQAEIAGVQFGTLSFSRQKMSDLHILDGQHRILGLVRARKRISEDLDKARSNLAAARKADPKGVAVTDAQTRIAKLEKERDRLSNESASIEIYVEDNLAAYRQIFADIADNQLGITASVRSRFDSRKVVNRALPLVEDHPLLQGRIDLERDRISGGFLLGAKHVAEVVRTVNVGLDGRVSRRQEEEFNEETLANRAKDFFTMLVEAFPQMQAVTLSQLTVEELRKTSLLGSVLFVRILGGVYYELVVEREYDRDAVKGFFMKLAPHVGAPVYQGDIWTTHILDNILSEGAMAPRGRRQDLKALKNAITGWAIDKPAWLDEKPALRPEEEEPSTEEEMRKADEILARK